MQGAGQMTDAALDQLCINTNRTLFDARDTTGKIGAPGRRVAILGTYTLLAMDSRGRMFFGASGDGAMPLAQMVAHGRVNRVNFAQRRVPPSNRLKCRVQPGALLNGCPMTADAIGCKID
jgi:hypothetical protein